MVTFVSLFLWLMTGVQTVEVAVEGPVASVEILLNGESIGIATPPRWQVRCDFGENLRPHRLVAIARDGQGAELGRAHQVVNLPRPDAEVEVVLEDGPSGSPERLRVVAVSAERLEPLSVIATFDGRMLTRDGSGQFLLPPFNAKRVHIIGAEAHFPNGVSARADATFGGAYGSRVVSNLTAVPIVVEGRVPPSPSDLTGILHANGETLTVAAIEHLGARLYLVRDHRSWRALMRSGSILERRTFVRPDQIEARPDLPAKKDRYNLVVPNPTQRRGLSLFPVVDAFDLKRWGLPWLATHVFNDQATVRGQRLAEAVAVAAVRAAGDSSPRAVVLVLPGNAEDASRYSPRAVREYMRALRVPLVVWSTRDGDPIEGWGVATDISSVSKLRKASRAVIRRLRRQWIVWVEGQHLPREIELDAGAHGFRLAG